VKGLTDPEQRCHDATLACACPADDTDLLAALHAHADALDHRRQFGAVAHDDLLHLDLAARGPVRGRPVLRHLRRRLLLDRRRVVHDALDRVHVVLDLRRLADHPAERLLDGDDVRERDTGLRRTDLEACADGEQRDDEGEHRAQEIETDSKPTLDRLRQFTLAH
jgi:hypothetical protein